MQISTKDLEKLSFSEMEDLLAGSRKTAWTNENTAAKYNFIGAVLKQHSYSKLGKRERGVVRQFLAKVAAVSRAQLTRLIGQWMEHRTIQRKPAHRPNFACLKPGLTAALLRQRASRHSDTEAAKLMQTAKLDLLKRVRP